MATLEERFSTLEKYVKQQKSWKEKHQHLKTKYDKLSDAHKTLINDYSDLKEATDPARIEKLQTALKKQAKISTEIREKAQSFDNLCQALAPLIPRQPAGPPGLEPGTAPQGRGISMAEIDERINQRLSAAKEIRVVEVDVDERLKQLVKDTIVDNIILKVKALPGPARKAAPWLCQRKEASVGELNEFLYEKSGRPSGAFYNNTVIPLEEAHLITRNQGRVTWTLRENLKTKLGDAISKEDLEKTRTYILSFLV